MLWEAWLVEMRTGQLSAKLGVLSGTWAETAGAAEEIKLSVDKKSLRGLDLTHWLIPWRAGILITVDGQPLVMGPLTAPPEIDRRAVSMTAGGPRSLLERRYATADDYMPGQGADLAESTLSYTGLSLGSIAWRLVQNAMDRRGGSLPIVHGSPDEVITPGNERNYQGFDISNLGTAHLLELLAGVIGGPQIRFDARWADDTHRRAEWAMRHGTKVSVDIPQDMVLTVDTTAPRGRIAEPTVKTAWTPYAKIYGTGAGEGSGTLIGIAENTDIMNNLPLIEAVISDTSAEDLDALTSTIQATLDTCRTLTVQVNTSVDTAEGQHPTLWHVGEVARVRLSDEWWPLPTEMDARIVTRKGAIGSSIVDVELQAEVVIA